jgi:hypothetical protein
LSLSEISVMKYSLGNCFRFNESCAKTLLHIAAINKSMSIVFFKSELRVNSLKIV